MCTTVASRHTSAEMHLHGCRGQKGCGLPLAHSYKALYAAYMQLAACAYLVWEKRAHSLQFESKWQFVICR